MPRKNILFAVCSGIVKKEMKMFSYLIVCIVNVIRFMYGNIFNNTPIIIVLFNFQTKFVQQLLVPTPMGKRYHQLLLETAYQHKKTMNKMLLLWLGTSILISPGSGGRCVPGIWVGMAFLDVRSLVARPTIFIDDI